MVLRSKTAYSIIAVVAITTIGSVFYSYEYYSKQSQHEFDKGFFNDVGDNTISSANPNTVVSRGYLFLQQPLQIEGLAQTYNVGQKIKFTVKFNGTGYDCGYPDLKIEDGGHQKIWQSGNTVHSCDPDMKEEHIEKEWQIENTPLGIPMINKTGFYTLFAEFDNDIIQYGFWIKTDSDIKIMGLEDAYKVGDNVRFYVTVQGTGMIPCEDFTVSVKKDRGQTVFYIPTYNSSCQIPVKPENYKFVYPQKNESYQLRMNETGTYTISANFGENSLEKEFVVKDNTKIKYHTGYSNLIQE